MPGVTCISWAGGRRSCSTVLTSVDLARAPLAQAKVLPDSFPVAISGSSGRPTPEVVPESATMDGMEPSSMASFTACLRLRLFLSVTKFLASASSIRCLVRASRLHPATKPLVSAPNTRRSVRALRLLAYLRASLAPFELSGGDGSDDGCAGGGAGRDCGALPWECSRSLTWRGGGANKRALLRLRAVSKLMDST